HDPSPGQRVISDAETAWYNRVLRAFAKAGNHSAIDILEGVATDDNKDIIDCVRFTGIVQDIANESDSPEVFLDALARSFTGAADSHVDTKLTSHDIPIDVSRFTDRG